MNDREFRAFMDLLMCSDPWPSSNINQDYLTDLADKEAKKRGYTDWVTAYHQFMNPTYEGTKYAET